MEPGSAAQSDASVARILRADGRPEGAGCLPRPAAHFLTAPRSPPITSPTTNLATRHAKGRCSTRASRSSWPLPQQGCGQQSAVTRRVVEDQVLDGPEWHHDSRYSPAGIFWAVPRGPGRTACLSTYAGPRPAWRTSGPAAPEPARRTVVRHVSWHPENRACHDRGMASRLREWRCRSASCDARGGRTLSRAKPVFARSGRRRGCRHCGSTPDD